MKLQYTDQFVKDYHNLPPNIQKQTDRKLRFLLEDIGHPSLRVKKIKGEKRNIYEGSVTMNYRFLFQIKGDTYLLLAIGSHKKMLGR
ncbi:MAG: type II toxin-antitoxin system RelE/ParE family toxin [bacterium]